ncbi:unnamed protein product [Protopolystoma xenopodis]|uniref:Uncharacterized protein n=1 Tax=Protopolystoma xenopodis TaxID=117903 RepID=A0A448X6D9_9PLAT|nr:unnamed protein product [Protopolystoma xenopodis]
MASRQLVSWAHYYHLSLMSFGYPVHLSPNHLSSIQTSSLPLDSCVGVLNRYCITLADLPVNKWQGCIARPVHLPLSDPASFAVIGINKFGLQSDSLLPQKYSEKLLDNMGSIKGSMSHLESNKTCSNTVDSGTHLSSSASTSSGSLKIQSEHWPSDTSQLTWRHYFVIRNPSLLTILGLSGRTQLNNLNVSHMVSCCRLSRSQNACESTVGTPNQPKVTQEVVDSGNTYSTDAPGTIACIPFVCLIFMCPLVNGVVPLGYLKCILYNCF